MYGFESVTLYMLNLITHVKDNLHKFAINNRSTRNFQIKYHHKSKRF